MRAKIIDPQVALQNRLVDALKRTRDFSRIETDTELSGLELDVVATRRDSGAIWIFEVIGRRKLIAEDIANKIVEWSRMLLNEEQQAKWFVVTTGVVTAEAKRILSRNNIDVWTNRILTDLEKPTVGRKSVGKPSVDEVNPETIRRADSLSRLLIKTPTGPAGWTQFQKLCSEVLQLLFCPPLEPPQYEHSDADKKNRRDMIFENNARDGFWYQMRQAYAADYIVVDAKNYAQPIKKQQILDVAHYLKRHGCGLFGIILSRKGTSAAADHAIREHWITSNKLIIVLSEQDIHEMLVIKSSSGAPEELIRRRIADFRLSL